MKRATHELGGNMVLIGGFGGTITIAKTSSTTAAVGQMEATHGVGWAIRVKAPSEAAPPVVTPSRSAAL